MLRATLPSPEVNSFSIGPVTVHFYALCILAGIVVALWWSMRRWRSRGGDTDALYDITFVAILTGIVGARLYHVVSTPDPYFGPGGDPVAALYIWNGGLGIWGAVMLGAVGAWWMSRRRGVRLADVADVLAPTILLAQAIGRLGNWFNQELYGGPTDLPWGLEITCRGGEIPGCVPGVYHPTFLYEMLWNLAGVAVILVVERRFRLGGGRTFWLYVLVYTSGRAWIEAMRTDYAELIFGVRLNVWVSLLLLILAVVMLVRLRDGRLRPVGPGPAPAVAGDAPGRLVSFGVPASALPAASPDADDPRDADDPQDADGPRDARERRSVDQPHHTGDVSGMRADDAGRSAAERHESPQVSDRSGDTRDTRR